MSEALEDFLYICILMLGIVVVGSVGGVLFAISMNNHPQDAKFHVGQVVVVDIPGDTLKVKITKVRFYGEMKTAKYDASYVRDGHIMTLHYLEEWELKE